MFLKKILLFFKRKEIPVKKVPVVINKSKFKLHTEPYTEDILKIRQLAIKNRWEEIDLQPTNKLISFRKYDTRLNIYYSTFTVGTCLDHPIKGKTQLFRKNVEWGELEKVFSNPRAHTGKGYYRKY